MFFVDSQRTSERLADLARLLERDRYLWSPRPFTGLPVTWEERHPHLAARLRSLDERDVENLESGRASMETLHPPIADLIAEYAACTAWPALGSAGGAGFTPRRRLSRRKLEQVELFARALDPWADGRTRRWLDWCSGKGHLGRLLSERTARPVVCVERDRALCVDGADLAKEEGLDVEFFRADVLRDDTSDLFTPDTTCVALHACGELGMAFLRRCVEGCCHRAAIATCCYQKISDDEYEPMSAAARELPVSLTRHHLRLACFDEVVATAGRRKLRRREQAWRLAADLRIREVTGEDRYTPLGPLPRRSFAGSFGDFMADVSGRTGYALSGVDLSAIERAGAQRLVTVRALGLVRGLFRRAIESLLVLDRIAFLCEHGYRAGAGTFCPSSVTPRNLIILGERA